jgi:hypothetical protein
MNRTLRVILGIVVLVVVAGGSFYGGTVYGQNQVQAAFAARRQGAFPFPGGTPEGAFAGQGQRGGTVFGQIAEIGDGVLVVTDNNGKQTQVHVTDTTLIEKNASVPLADLKTGETVIVSGSQDADGSITARSVQVSPAGRFGIGGPSGTPESVGGQ